MLSAFGRSITEVNGTLTASAGPFAITRQGGIEDARDGFGDLIPMASLRWNHGVDNWMTYIAGDIPTGIAVMVGANLVMGIVGYRMFKTGYKLKA